MSHDLHTDERTDLPETDLARAIEARGVHTRPEFLGMHQQPVFRSTGPCGGEPHHAADMPAREGLHLPYGAALTRDRVTAVRNAVNEAIA